MKLLVVTHNYPRFPGDPAGAFVANLAREAVGNGIDVAVVAPHAPGTELTEVLHGALVTRFRYAPDSWERVAYTGDLHRRAASSPLVALTLPFFLGRFRRAVRAAIRTFKPDVIHAHWWLPGGWLVADLGIPFLITCHGSDVRLLDRAPLRLLARRVLPRARLVSTVSEFLERDLLRRVPDLAGRTMVTPMPVDVEHFSSGLSVPAASPPRILYAGNLVPSKGVGALIEACAILQARNQPFGLRILGEGPDLDRLTSLAREHGVAERTEWLPFQPQTRMPHEYGEATVTVLPTLGNAEGLGLVLVEALLAGSAVVGSKAGGIPEVIEDGATGRLVDGGDPVQLADALEWMLADPDRRRLTAERGRERVRRRFSPAAAFAPFRKAYEQLASR